MKIIVTGGGTGGHIYPVVAIAKKLMAHHTDCEIIYVGTKHGIESEIAPKEGLSFEGISARGFTGRKPLKLMKAAFVNGRGVAEALGIVRRFRPDLIIGSGGYASAPLVFAGALMKVPVVLHEQNAFPGRANLFLSKWASRVFISYEEARKYFPDPSKVVFTGNPVREAFRSIQRDAARIELEMASDRLHFMSFGGSGGAKRINDLILSLMKRYQGHPRIELFHVTGSKYYESFLKQMEEASLLVDKTDKWAECGSIRVAPYLHDIPRYMAAADLILCRAGATTLAELQAVHTPSILVPSPNVKDNHQEHNARSFEKGGVAVVVTEGELDENRIAAFLESCMTDPAILEAMRDKSKALEVKDPLDVLYEEIRSLLGIK